MIVGDDSQVCMCFRCLSCDVTDFVCPLVNPIALEQVHEEATLGYSTIQNTATQKDAAEPRKAQNPYTLKAAAWKGEPNWYS